jgi:hypothetical protein
MDKDDILKEKLKNIHFNNSYHTFNKVIEAMEDYAKTEAINFHKFCTHEHNWIDKIGNNSQNRELLYELYQQYKTKNEQ